MYVYKCSTNDARDIYPHTVDRLLTLGYFRLVFILAFPTAFLLSMTMSALTTTVIIITIIIIIILIIIIIVIKRNIYSAPIFHMWKRFTVTLATHKHLSLIHI